MSIVAVVVIAAAVVIAAVVAAVVIGIAVGVFKSPCNKYFGSKMQPQLTSHVNELQISPHSLTHTYTKTHIHIHTHDDIQTTTAISPISTMSDAS